MRTEEQIEFFSGEGGDIKNCQVVEFASVNGKLGQVKSSNPHRDEMGSWSRLERKLFAPEELLIEVNKYPHMVKTEK